MAEINKAVLAKLAAAVNKTQKDDLSHLGVNFDDAGHSRIGDTIKRRMEARQEEAEAEAADHIVNLLETATVRIDSCVEQIREARRTAEHHLSVLRKIERAREYGLETMDFMPLVELLENPSSYNMSTKPLVHQIPEDWMSKKKATETKKPVVKKVSGSTVAK